MKTHRRLFIIFFTFLQIVAAKGVIAGSDFYYSVHGASYREQEQAKAHIASIQTMGYPAFSDQVNIPGKGLWYRVYIGKYRDREAAKKAANLLRKKKVIDYFSINRFNESDIPARTPAGKKAKMAEKQLAIAQSPKPAPPVKEKKSEALDRVKKEKMPEKRLGIAQSPQPESPVKGKKSEALDRVKKETQPERQAPILQEPLPAPPEGVAKGGESVAVPSPLDNALSAFRSERYEQAIELLKVLLKDGRLDQATHEKGLRLMADCYYSWGAKGNHQLLLTAIDQYKDILKRSPDSAGMNDRLYYNLAMSYEKLNFLYEASGIWEKLIFAYPNSTLLEEAMFRVGDVLRSTGKFNRTVDKLTAYLKKYPDGLFAKAAYFAIGDSYYRTQRGDLASRWFDEARKKWYDLYDIPQTVLFNMGNNYFDSGRFDDAFQVFSLCSSLYASSDFGKNTLFRTARAADEAGHASMAIKLYTSFMAKYPRDVLADECSLSLANLGVAKPGMRVSMNVANMDDYREPFQTYKRILSKNAGGEQTERTMLFKGSALEKQGAIKDAVANYLDMFNRFPKGKYREEAGKRLKNIALMLFDAYYAKGDHLAVADLYFKVNGKIILTDDFDIAFKTGQSLQRLGFYEEAGGLYSALKEVKKSNREITSRLTLALAHMDVMKKKYGEAEDKVQLLLREEKDRKNDTTIKQTLADIYYRQGSFEKAVEFYADSLGHEKGERQTAAYMNYARSLQNRQMTQAAQKNYLSVYKDYQLHPDKYDNTDIVDMLVGLGDGHCNEKKFKEGILMYKQALSLVSDMDSKKWLLFKIGQGYAYLRDFEEAENSFVQIKEGKAGDFWIKIADLYIAENRRMERNEVRR